MNGRTIRTGFITAAFLATVAAMTVVGATGRGESYPIVDICETTAWPMIPTHCLDGGSDRDVRVIAVADARQAMARADIKSEPSVTSNSGKGDLLRRPDASSASHVIVETRGDGVSVLRRVPVETQH